MNECVLCRIPARCVRLVAHGRQSRVWTIPNALSASRFLLAPYIGHLILAGAYLPAMEWTVVAGITDLVSTSRLCTPLRHVLFF